MRPADFCLPTGSSLECRLCPVHCVIPEGGRGRCQGRGSVGGRMVLHNYGRVVAAHVDPIEKKPLYHVCPGRPILSIGTFGCNLWCRFCQNSDLSQAVVEADVCSPERLADWAVSVPGNLGVAFTYNEPGIWYEYVLDAAKILRDRRLMRVMVTNGFLEEAPWAELCTVIDAMNIDVKAFTEEFYRDLCGGALEPVKRNVAAAVRAGVHVEVTHLIIPGRNDVPDDFRALVSWLAGIDPGIPLHLSRYFPRHRETAPPTAPETLLHFRELAAGSLHHVYVGNLATTVGQDTRCHACGDTLVERSGYQTRILVDGSTCRCGAVVPILGIPERGGQAS